MHLDHKEEPKDIHWLGRVTGGMISTELRNVGSGHYGVMEVEINEDGIEEKTLRVLGFDTSLEASVFAQFLEAQSDAESAKGCCEGHRSQKRKKEEIALQLGIKPTQFVSVYFNFSIPTNRLENFISDNSN